MLERPGIEFVKLRFGAGLSGLRHGLTVDGFQAVEADTPAGAGVEAVDLRSISVGCRPRGGIFMGWIKRSHTCAVSFLAITDSLTRFQFRGY